MYFSYLQWSARNVGCFENVLLFAQAKYEICWKFMTFKGPLLRCEYFLSVQKYMVVVCLTIIWLAEWLFWRRCPFYLKKFITTELIFKILPFCVFNHLFCCSRTITVPINFSRRQLENVSCWCTKFFFVHSYSAFAKEKIYSDRCNNFGVLHYECISNPFILYKTNLELLCRIASQFTKWKSKI